MNNFSRLDLKKRERFLKAELKLIQLKSLFHDISMPKRLRRQAQQELALLRNSSRYKIKNRCIVSSRGKAIYRKLQLSRILLRDLGHQGHIIGFSKASW